MDTRYSREQLLELFRELKDTGELEQGIEGLFVGDWTESLTNGAGSSKWNRRDDSRNEHTSGPEVCCDRTGATEPLALFEMSEDEREVICQCS